LPPTAASTRNPMILRREDSIGRDIPGSRVPGSDAIIRRHVSRAGYQPAQIQRIVSSKTFKDIGGPSNCSLTLRQVALGGRTESEGIRSAWDVFGSRQLRSAAGVVVRMHVGRLRQSWPSIPHRRSGDPVIVTCRRRLPLTFVPRPIVDACRPPLWRRRLGDFDSRDRAGGAALLAVVVWGYLACAFRALRHRCRRRRRLDALDAGAQELWRRCSPPIAR